MPTRSTKQYLYDPHPSSVPQSPTLPAFDLPSEASITPKTSYESTGEISTTSNGSRSRHMLDIAPASPRSESCLSAFKTYFDLFWFHLRLFVICLFQTLLTLNYRLA